MSDVAFVITFCASLPPRTNYLYLPTLPLYHLAPMCVAEVHVHMLAYVIRAVSSLVK